MANRRNTHDVPPFLGEPGGDLKDARFVVLPVPYEKTTTYLKGTASGPRAILDASANIESFDEAAGVELVPEDLFTAPPFSGSPPPAELPEKLRRAVAPHARAGRLVVALGGEHAVTLGPVLACRDAWPDLSVLQLDAHADLRDAYEGTPHSHACIGKRIQEHVPLVQAGIRSLSAGEARALPGLNVKTFFRKDLRPLDPERARAVVDALTEHVYLSVDIDVFDPAFAPGTGTPEPGGLDWFEVSCLLEEVVRRKSLVAMDVCEVRPLPGDVRTEVLAARLILRALAFVKKRGESGTDFES